MSLIVKAFLYSNWFSDEATEIRRFSIDQDVATSYAYLTQKIAQVFSNLKADEVKITYLGMVNIFDNYHLLVLKMMMVYVYSNQ